MKFLLAAMALCCLFVVPSPANAWIDLCNRTNKEIVYSKAMITGASFLTRTWTQTGWHTLKPGCDRIQSTGVAASIYLVMFTKQNGKLVPLENTFRIREKRSNNKTVSGPSVLEASSLKICTKSNSHKRRRKGPARKWSSCSAGETPLPATLYAFGKASQLTTITFKNGTVSLSIRTSW